MRDNNVLKPWVRNLTFCEQSAFAGTMQKRICALLDMKPQTDNFVKHKLRGNGGK